MKTSKIIIFIISIIIIVQLGLSFSNYHTKMTLATDPSSPLVKIELNNMPYKHYRSANSVQLDRAVSVKYDEAKPLADELKFNERGTMHLPSTKIYLTLKKDGDYLAIDSYSLSKPQGQNYLIAKSNQLYKNKETGEIRLSTYIIKLKDFKLEGDKSNVIHNYINATGSNNRKLNSELHKKEITQEEYDSQYAKPYAILAIDSSGNFAIRDVVIGDKSISKDF